MCVFRLKKAGIMLVSAIIFALAAGTVAAAGNQRAVAQKSAAAAPMIKTQAGSGPAWNILDVTAVGCSDSEFTFSVQFQNLPANSFFHTVADAGGLRYMNEQFEGTNNGVREWSLFDLDDGGVSSPLTGIWPIPQSTPINISFSVRSSFDGPIITQTRVTVDGCESGVITRNSSDRSIPTLSAPFLGLMAVLMLLAGGFYVRRVRH